MLSMYVGIQKSIIKMTVDDKLQVNDMMRLKVFDKLDVL